VRRKEKVVRREEREAEGSRLLAVGAMSVLVTRRSMAAARHRMPTVLVLKPRVRGMVRVPAAERWATLGALGDAAPVCYL
jgi:hypothetical protein